MRSCLIVSDDDQFSSQTRLAPVGLPVRSVGDHRQDHAPDLAVFDVDLARLDHFYAVQANLEALRPVETLFLIDTRQRVERHHVKVLNGTHVMDRSASPQQVWVKINQLSDALRAKQVQRSIAGVATGLRTTFDGYRSKTKLDGPGVELAVNHALAGIGDDHVSWMEGVRGHHEGTFQHCLLVTGFMAAFASGLGMRRTDQERLTTAALLHDIGKMSVPVAVLDKPGKPTAQELQIIQQHPTSGHEYLRRHSSVSGDILHAVLHHHELLDGTGYPRNLSRTDIPDMTRMLTIVDINAALVEKRSYKEPMSQKAAGEILSDMARHEKLDGDLVRAFLKIVLIEG